MRTDTLLDFTYQDGKNVMHVRYTHFVGSETAKDTPYCVSHSNTMREQGFAVHGFGDPAIAMDLALKLREQCYEDIADLLRQVGVIK